jgi:uncharacterized membrane protein YfcA
LFGVGGGVILLPLLRLFLGLRQHQAQGLTLAALLLPGGLPAMLHYHRRGITIPWVLVTVMILGFLPGVWAGARFACRLPDGPLRWGFVGFLLLLAAWTALPGAKRARIEPGPSGTPKPSGPAAPMWQGAVVGVIGGVASGLFGIGGGVVMIPLLVLWLRLPQLQAQLVSLAVMIPPIRLPGLLVYAHGWHDFPWVVLYGLAGGFVLGTYLGARLAIGLPSRFLSRGFSCLMLLTAGLMIWKG